MARLLLLITLFSLSTRILSLAESISIDCGTTGSYVDSNNVTWIGDKGFVTTGKPIKIPDVVTKPVNTLRYFPTGETNCYTNIPATKGRNNLVRTKFFYENYDGKMSPPSFDLIYDGKHRDSVVISESLVNDEEAFYFSEVIYAPENDKISVCLLRTSPSDNPFISSIEVYSMDTGMYNDVGPYEGLILQERITYGAIQLISYPLDPYGRLWAASGSQDNPLLTDLTTSAPSIDITGASNKPPQIVMSKALSADGLILSDLNLPSAGIPVYLAFYFSEPQSLGRTQIRSFNVFLDDTQVGSGPIVPVFGKATQIVLRDVVATSGSKIVFQSTADSVLQPLINGLEIYSIRNSSRDSGDGGGDGGGSGGGGGDQGGGAKDDSEGSGGPSARAKTPAVSKMSGGKKNKKSKLPLILGLTFASAFTILSSAFGATFWRKRRNAKSNTAPTTTSTEKGTGHTGMSPLVGQQFASEMHDSYVNQEEHR